MEEYCWVYHVGRRIILSIFTCSSCLQPNSTWDFPGLGTTKWQGYQPVVHWHDPASSSSFCTWRLGHVWGIHVECQRSLPFLRDAEQRFVFLWSRATGTSNQVHPITWVCLKILWKSRHMTHDRESCSILKPLFYGVISGQCSIFTAWKPQPCQVPLRALCSDACLCGAAKRSLLPKELVFPGYEKIMFLYGYGSIPIDTIFRGMNIHLPAILGFTRGTRVLTHNHMFLLYLLGFQLFGMAWVAI